MNIDSVQIELDNMNIDCVNTKSDNMNIDYTITKSNNMNIDCTRTESDNMNIDRKKTKSIAPSISKESPEPYDIFKQLPLEVITKIVLHLSFNDVISLKSVSKAWRCIYINQNEIWANICDDLNIRVIDYSRCLNDRARHDSECKGYAEAASEKLFGPLCDYWLTFNHYIMIIRNIKNNDFATIYIPRCARDEYSYCTDDYIVNINAFNKQPIQVFVLSGANKPIVTKYLKMFDQFKKLIRSRKYPVKVIGNKRYLVFEICSIIFVYSIARTEFTQSFFKVIRKNVEFSLNEENFDSKFLNEHRDTKFDLYDHKLAMVHPAGTLFLTDLRTGKTYKELKFSSKRCIVNSMKCSDYRIMIGITIMKKKGIEEYLAIIYHMKGCSQDNRLKIPLLKPVSQFKVTNNCIGIENKGTATPFITKIDSYLKVFWLECETFSFDCTRKYIYYTVNQSIFQYDLLKSMLSKFEVVQKIAINAISNLLPLTPINDRYLLVRSTFSNSYDIFDVKEHTSVRSIQLTAGYSLVHVGKLSIVFSNSKEFMVIAFN
ncbi:F-box domain-containing protein [Aphis craccivora]|uniref:F-box domain-containing protein n=1 Tax=Aphis craccivora TaxID=307492 RepID=A0A6G0YQH4_APHCR|nr:F-box domain-containing protein [Aphis craccivora]